MPVNKLKTYHLSKNESQLLRSLHRKKERYSNNLFLIEGVKPVLEAVKSNFTIKNVYLSDHLSEHVKNEIFMLYSSNNINIIRESELRQISTMKTPEGVVATGEINLKIDISNNLKDLPGIYLWKINDPGNLGTIIRTASWYGIKNIFLSPDSVDPYNPKVVRATMGAFFHVNIHKDKAFDELYNDLKNQNVIFYSADLNVENPEMLQLKQNSILCFGSESHGTPEYILNKSDKILSIPKFGYGESLNLGISVGIILNSIINGSLKK